ncbi:uncharacterized protein [Chelonus insularis]|uniref:uncharacterized protein n=1 Tax=Chelonus insularis TaxID=460826 RepID=UPI00158A7167|nr:uncharacterized protein LOC118070276 [Chelonus insularis]
MEIKWIYLLVLIYIIEKGFAAFPNEQEKRDYYFKIKERCWEHCKSTISEENLEIYEDDLGGVENEQICAYKYCMAEFIGFIKNNKIDIDKILSEGQQAFPKIRSHEFIAGKALLKSCKTAAESADDGPTVYREFSKCITRESSVQFE